MFRTFAYFRGAYLYRRIKGFLLEIFDEVDRKVRKLYTTAFKHAARLRTIQS